MMSTLKKEKTRQITPNIWEIAQDTDPDMNVPVHIYSNDALYENLDNGVINQAMNVASLPGLEKSQCHA